MLPRMIYLKLVLAKGVRLSGELNVACEADDDCADEVAETP